MELQALGALQLVEVVDDVGAHELFLADVDQVEADVDELRLASNLLEQGLGVAAHEHKEGVKLGNLTHDSAVDIFDLFVVGHFKNRIVADVRGSFLQDLQLILQFLLLLVDVLIYLAQNLQFQGQALVLPLLGDFLNKVHTWLIKSP